MNNMLLQYLAESGVALVVFYLFYVLVLRRQTCFGFNRFYLLAALVLSFLLPFLGIGFLWEPAPLSTNVTVMVAEIPTNTYQTGVMAAEPMEPNPFPFHYLLYFVYLAGIGLFTYQFCHHFLKLYSFIYSHTASNYFWQNIKIIPTHGELPTFSFLRYIFFDNTLALSTAEKELVLQHEAVHLTQKHSFDIIFIKLLRIIFWFNPLLYFYKNQLEAVHEFLADRQVIQAADAETYATLLVNQVFQKVGFSFGNFFHLTPSSTLNRLTMMKHINRKPNLFRQVLTFPLIGILVFSLASNKPVSLPTLSSASSIPTNKKATEAGAIYQSANTLAEPIFTDSSITAPQFPGGEAEMYRFLNKNIKYPAPGLVENVPYTRVMITVKIDKNGNPETNNSYIKDVFMREVYRVTNLLPKFEPALKNGEPVASNFILSVYFRLSSDATKIDFQKNKPYFKIINGIPTVGSRPIVVTVYSKNSTSGSSMQNALPNNKNQRAYLYQTLPQFPGGKSELRSYLSKNTHYPAYALKNKITGQAIIQATIDASGSATSFRTLHSDNSYFEQEALRVLKEMPRWQPGTQNDNPAAYTVVFPFIFGLNSNKNLPALKLPANRAQLNIQDATNIVGYDNVINGRTVVQSSTTPVNKTKPSAAPAKDDKVFTFVEEQPQFADGQTGLTLFLKKNIKYPPQMLKKGLEGLVIVQFVVGSNGKITEPKVVKSLHPDGDAEALRVIKLMPDFMPAKQNGKPVAFRYTLPIRFGMPASQSKIIEVGAGKQGEKKAFMPEPLFPGGKSELQSFFRKNVKYAPAAMRTGIAGQVIVQATVNQDGYLENIKLLKSDHALLDQEVITVIKKLPRWTPASQNGQNQKFDVIFPFIFELNGEHKMKVLELPARQNQLSVMPITTIMAFNPDK